ncbi:MAG: hypothetical protein ACRDZ9_06125 [Acidimicrobiales bacterium]
MRRAYHAVIGLVAVVVLVQAVMAGQSDRLFGDLDITLHGVLGNVVFALGLVAVGLAVAARAGRSVVVTTVVLAVLLTIQVGLGYSGRTSLSAAAWHIPNGVAIFGLLMYNLASAPR